MADLGEDAVEVKPPIIMKVDAPPEDNTITSQGSSVNSTNSTLDKNDTVKTSVKSKKPVLASSRLNSNSSPLTMRSSVLSSPKLNSGVLLRPSALGSRLENNKTTENSSKNPTRVNSDSNNGETPKFVPLVVTESSPTPTTLATLTTSTTTSSTTNTLAGAASTSNFVFGQNLHERVVSESEEGSSASLGATNGTSSSSDLLFTTSVPQVPNSTSKSLSESAREYEESRANKRKYEAVAVVTGEEGEQNVLQLHCKLFAFDKARGSWQERGRGTLRLNDQDTQQSRLVFRTSGSLRVVLNTQIWAEMTVERASDKSLRLTAMDATGQIKVFLIMASGEEVSQLERLLRARVAQMRDGEEPLNKKKH